MSRTPPPDRAISLNLNLNCNLGLSPALELLVTTGMATVADTLARMEDQMAKSFKSIMTAIDKTTQEIRDGEAADKARDEANAAKIAELEAQISSGNLSEDQTSEAMAALSALRDAAGLPPATDDAPEGGTPAPEPTPEPAPAPDGTGPPPTS